jgi:hypothetical protein
VLVSQVLDQIGLVHGSSLVLHPQCSGRLLCSRQRAWDAICLNEQHASLNAGSPLATQVLPAGAFEAT